MLQYKKKKKDIAKDEKLVKKISFKSLWINAADLRLKKLHIKKYVFTKCK